MAFDAWAIWVIFNAKKFGIGAFNPLQFLWYLTKIDIGFTH
jgi:hypothetical protein